MFRGAGMNTGSSAKVNLYRLRYVSLVNDLLRALAETQDYACVQHYALNAAELMPGEPESTLLAGCVHLSSRLYRTGQERVASPKRFSLLKNTPY